VLALVLFLLLLEVGMRVIEPRLSSNIAHLRAQPETASEMRAHPGRKILLMGNSLTRNAVDAELLASAYPQKDSARVFTLLGDATSAIHWDYGFRRFYLHTSSMPDELFIGTGPAHLRDAHGDASRLGAYFVADRDIPQILANDLPRWDEKCEFFLARLSTLHAARGRIKQHVFGRLIPHYFDIEQWINTCREGALLRSGKAMADKPSFHHLQRLLLACRQAGVKASFFSVPLPAPYEVPAEAIRLITEAGGRWLPLADSPGLTAKNFPDSYHLDPAGANILTHGLIKALQISPTK
jgi:hypothetical protein